MKPALHYTLSAKWPAPGEIEPATTKGANSADPFARISIRHLDLPATIELLASTPSDEKHRTSLLITATAQDTESILHELQMGGQAIFVLQFQPHEHEIASGGNEEQRHQFVSTYYRTALAWQVQDILTALAYLTESAGFDEVRLAGIGEAGIPTLLARALEPTGKVSLTIADLAGVNSEDERTWTGKREQAGMLRFGGLRTAAILAAPGELVLHNTSARFDTAIIRQAYRAIDHASALEISKSPWTVGMVLKRLEKDK